MRLYAYTRVHMTTNAAAIFLLLEFAAKLFNSRETKCINEKTSQMGTALSVDQCVQTRSQVSRPGI